jgi:hypothetical protein
MNMKRMMGMGLNNVNSGGPNVAIANPIQLLNNYAPLSETSLVPQTTTEYTIGSGGIISRHNALATRSAFALIINILLYSPGKNRPVKCSDFIPAQADGTPSQSRNYQKLYQIEFGNGFHMAGFILNNIPPVSSQVTITLNHPPAKRRIVTSSMWANFASGDPLDRLSDNISNRPSESGIHVGPTKSIKSSNELVYGIIGIGGPFNQFIAPPDFVGINDIGTSIDNFDCAVKTFYQLTSTNGEYTMRGNITGKSFDWGAVLITINSSNVVPVNTK